MKGLILYDSAYGNTEKIAQAIGAAARSEIDVRSLDSFSATVLDNYDYLIIGSPTQGGRPLESLSNFVHSLDDDAIDRLPVAVFDTRMDPQSQPSWLKLIMSVIGYAAPKMAKQLQNKGAQVLVPPEGFIVEDKEGPLRTGELLRAAEWLETMKGELK